MQEDQVNDSSGVSSQEQFAAIELAIVTARQLGKVRVESKGVERLSRWATRALVASSVLLVIAVAAALMHWDSLGLLAAILSLLLAMGSLTAQAAVNFAAIVTVRRQLAKQVNAVHSAALLHAQTMWTSIPKASAWEHATRALDHASRRIQQWRTFAAAFLAIVLTMYLATRSTSCVFGTPLDLIRELPQWDFASNPADPCALRGWIGAALLGMMLAVIPLQWKVGTLLNATTLAQRTLEHGQRNSLPAPSLARTRVRLMILRKAGHYRKR